MNSQREARSSAPVEKRCHPRRWLRRVLVASAVAGAAGILWYVNFTKHALELPDALIVQAMQASLQKERANDEVELEDFTVPRDHVPMILAALRPAHRDWFGAKWAFAGRLDLTCSDGLTYRIDLYWTRESVGAFSVHRSDWERNPGFIVANYFRGGSDKGMREAIRAAHAAQEAALKQKQLKGE